MTSSSSPVWSALLAAVAFTTLGAVAGWVAHQPTHVADAGDNAADEAARPHLGPETLANLGVRVEPLAATSFVRTVSVAGVVIDTPTTERPVYAPIGGRVETVTTAIGTTVRPGETVVSLVRDPLPRPELTLTAELLKPAQESLHDAVFDLRRSSAELDLTRTELERVEKYTGQVGEHELPVLPRQREIDLRYALARAETAYEQARHELLKHGLDDEQVAAVEGGAGLPRLNEEAWKRALDRNGLWPASAERLNAALPAALTELPWVVATIGELAASGLATDALAEWLAADEDAGRHFLEFGVLLQQGHTLPDLQRLHALNAFEPIVHVSAPPAGEEHGDEDCAWDLHEVLVKPGATVEAGAPLARLRDPHLLRLRVEPVGSEVMAVLAAAAEGAALRARPLVRGAGPDLEELRIAWVENSAGNEGTVAFVDVDNEILAETVADDGRRTRTWALRSGVRYLLEVPTGRLDDVYVLPAGAVADRGPDKVVFLADGDDFRPVAVRVLYRDDEVVVLPARGDVTLFPGDRVVQAGAFALGLALNAETAVDAHAGHSH